MKKIEAKSHYNTILAYEFGSTFMNHGASNKDSSPLTYFHPPFSRLD